MIRLLCLVPTRACGTIPFQETVELRYVFRVREETSTFKANNRNKADSVFSGISTFGRLPYWPCLASDDEDYDIAFLGELVIRHIVGEPYLTIFLSKVLHLTLVLLTDQARVSDLLESVKVLDASTFSMCTQFPTRALPSLRRDIEAY
jgi:hypothetical protein